ncbi:MAG: hypothetical protein CMA68_05395 [Euryarchaeota archaeon]|nr:hypothetical protein [Euryarchaeota archaeon]
MARKSTTRTRMTTLCGPDGSITSDSIHSIQPTQTWIPMGTDSPISARISGTHTPRTRPASLLKGSFATHSHDRAVHCVALTGSIDRMSWWILPTTADIGIRAFSSSPERAIAEATMGMQSIQMSELGMASANSLPRNTGTWVVNMGGDDIQRGMVRWMEEVLYRCDGESQWLVDNSISITDGEIAAQVSWVDSDLVEREIEVKAVTMHELLLREVVEGEVLAGVGNDIPSFEGPGWVAQVVLDV